MTPEPQQRRQRPPNPKPAPPLPRKAEFLEEDNGNRSETRLMCFLSLLFSFAMSLLTVQLEDSGAREIGLLLSMAFLLGAFAPKVLQKYAEEKIDRLQ